MLKARLVALKTWKRIDANTSLEVLDILLKKEPVQHESYYQVFQALTFLESFRFLYQIFIVQEEEVHLDNEDVRRNLQRVANAMGYEDKSQTPATTQMLTHYFDHHKLARRGADRLLDGVTEHLRKNTIFYSITHVRSHQSGRTLLPENIPVDFIRKSRFFQGVRFWDDLLTSLDNPNQVLLKRFLADFQKLPADRREALMRTFVKWGGQSPFALISLFSIIANRQPKVVDTKFFQEFVRNFIDNLEPTLENISRLCQSLNLAPQMMNNFLSILPTGLLHQLIVMLEKPYWKPEIVALRNTLLMLCRIYFNNSYYFKRFVQRVFNTYAEYITSLNNQPKLNQLAEGLFRNIDNFDSLDEKFARLGDYYDFEFMRVGISLIDGAPFEKVNREFTHFSDNYLQMLFELCREQVASADPQREPEMHDLLAIFTAGGHARGQAFDDDYDLIVLVNSEDPEILDFCDKVLQKMNKRIIRRSIIPQFRFADRFRHFVTTFDDLRGLFEKPDEDSFIDQSQLLGARMVVGSAHFLDVFQQEIIAPYIFRRKSEFICAMQNEIRARHEYSAAAEVPDIKEGRGGLRDFENFIFILKAQFEWPEPLNMTLYNRIAETMAEPTHQFAKLVDDYHLLKHIRDLYRLIVSHDDHLQPAQMENLIKPLSLSRGLDLQNGNDLTELIRSTMHANAERIDALSALVSLPEPIR
jgi:hypothetical protein